MYNDKIIEFYGDTYHANPAIFNEIDTPNPYNKNITSAQIWDIDKKRIDILQNRGYNILIIWSSEYISDKIGTVNKCLEFLRNN